MDGSVVSTQTAPSAGPRHYYGEPLSVPYGCSATAQESWAIGAGSVDPRKLQSTAVQTHRQDASDDGGWVGSLSVSHNTSPPVDSGSFASPEYQYHYPFGTPLEIGYGNSVMPRQDPLLSSFYASPPFVDHPPQMVGNGFTPLPSPEHSLPGYEQTQDPRSGHFFGTGPSYPLYQEPATLATGNEPCQDPTMMWNALTHEVSLSQPIEQPSFFGDAMIMTPASDILNTDSPLNSISSDDETADADGSNALQKAGFHGHDAVVELLLDSGADIETRNTRGQTTLHLAAQQGHSNVVTILLQKRANRNAKDSRGLTPLHLASKHGHQRITRLLLGAGININERDNQGQNALHYASGGGFLAVVQLLVDGGITPNVRSSAGLTPLHRAAENGHDAVVRLLLERGADVNATSDNG